MFFKKHLTCFIAAFALPLQAFAEIPVPDALCKNEIIRTITGWGSKNDWRESPPDEESVRIYRSPTDQTGVWVGLLKDRKGEVRAIRLTRYATLVVSWDPRKQCESKIAPIVAPDGSKSGEAGFTDEKLDRLLDHGKGKGMIFLWSPHMPYSLKAVDEIRKAAKELEVPVEFVLDSSADPKAAKSDADKLKIPVLRNDSLELSQRGMELHFPSMLVYSRGKISPMLPGLCSAELYKKFTQEHL